MARQARTMREFERLIEMGLFDESPGTWGRWVSVELDTLTGRAWHKVMECSHEPGGMTIRMCVEKMAKRIRNRQSRSYRVVGLTWDDRWLVIARIGPWA